VAEWIVDVTDEEIDAALEDAAGLPNRPSAITAKYDRALDVILLGLDNGRRLVIPREDMQGLQAATESQIADIEIFGGTDISWPQLDLDHNLLSLLEGRYGSDEWMQNLGKRAVAA
jgi:hypothetical protein